MKKFVAGLSLALIVNLAGGFNVMANTSATQKYPDISESDPLFRSVMELSDMGVIKGYPDGFFRADNSINRAELLKMVMISKGSTATFDYDQCFGDVPTDAWFAFYVCHAKAHEIVDGYPGTNLFRPANDINSAEALKIIFGAYELDYQKDANPWHKGLMNEARTRFNFTQPPEHLITRGEVAMILHQFVKDTELYKSYNFDYGSTSEEDVSYEPLAESDLKLQNACLNKDCLDANPDYVIITRPLFVNSLQDFIDWKTKDGFKMGVLTLEYLQEAYPQDNPSKSMREGIKFFAKNKNSKYFVLVGDTKANDVEGDYRVNVQQMYDMSRPWNVPSGYYCRIGLFNGGGNLDDLKGDYTQCTETSDLYFADFDDEAWTENDDGQIMRGIFSNARIVGADGKFSAIDQKFGNTLDEHPLDFETIVARIAVRTPNEFEKYVVKLKKYKPAKNLRGFTGKSFLEPSNSKYETVDEQIYSEECDFDGFDDDEKAKYIWSCAENEIVIQHLFDKHGVEYSLTAFQEGLDEENQKAKESILSSDTQTVVSPHFHGSHYGVYLDKAVVDVDSAQEFKEIIPAWMASSCAIGTFNLDDGDALNEAMIKSDTGPVLVIHPTNSYYFYKDSLEGKTVGEAFYNVGETVFRYTSVSNNLFGDPSLKLFE